MRKRIVALSVMCLCVMASVAQNLGTLQSLIVPHADMVMVFQSGVMQKSEFVKQAMALNADWTEFAQKHMPSMKTYVESMKAVGVDLNDPNLIVEGIGSMAFNVDDPMQPDWSKVEFVVGVKLNQPMNVPAFKNILLRGWKEQLAVLQLTEKSLALEEVKGKSYEGVLITIAKTEQTRNVPVALSRLVCGVYNGNVVLFGNEVAVDAATLRLKRGEVMPLDPYLAANLQTDMAFAVRMFPVLKNLFALLQNPSMPFLAELGKGAGMVCSGKVTDKIDFEMAFECAAPQHAADFKKQMWDPQLAVLIGMVSGTMKAKTDYKLTCLDKLVCVADGKTIRIRFPFTVQDLEGWYGMLKTSILEEERAKKLALEAAKAPAAKAPAGKTPAGKVSVQPVQK